MDLAKKLFAFALQGGLSGLGSAGPDSEWAGTPPWYRPPLPGCALRRPHCGVPSMGSPLLLPDRAAVGQGSGHFPSRQHHSENWGPRTCPGDGKDLSEKNAKERPAGTGGCPSWLRAL